MSDNIPAIVARSLRSASGSGELYVGLFHRDRISIVEKVRDEGHRAVVLGDRFRKLYAAYRRLSEVAKQRITVVETRLEALPIVFRGFDAFILSSRLSDGESPTETLCELRELIKPGGLLVWPKRTADKMFGRVARAVTHKKRKFRTPFRSDICAWMMKAGFGDISQIPVKGTFSPWVVTIGRVGRRPWENAHARRDRRICQAEPSA